MSFPSMQETFWDWTSGVTFRVLNKNIVDFEIEEKEVVDLKFQGILEPIRSNKLLVKPEGQRNWKWYTLWTTQKLELDSVLLDPADKQFRVMSANEWNEAGYYEYELTEGVPNE